MNDRELLELSAKAAGIQLRTWGGLGCWSGEEDQEGFLTMDGDRWNPLTDDGDAIRLAVHLELDLNLGQYGTLVYMKRGTPNIEEFSDDCMASFRRAIVRAAATIGEAMP